MSDTELVDLDACCDAMLEALEGGLITVVQVEKGVYAEVLANRAGTEAVQINYCPFCATPRNGMDEMDDLDEAEAEGQSGGTA